MKSFASLRQFCERDNVTALRCEQGFEAKPGHYAVQVNVEMAYRVEVDAVSLESARDLAVKAARKDFVKYYPEAFRATAGYITEKEK